MSAVLAMVSDVEVRKRESRTHADIVTILVNSGVTEAFAKELRGPLVAYVERRVQIAMENAAPRASAMRGEDGAAVGAAAKSTFDVELERHRTVIGQASKEWMRYHTAINDGSLNPPMPSEPPSNAVYAALEFLLAVAHQP